MDTDPSSQPTRTAGIAIAAATIVSTVFVALDRSGGGSNPEEILQGIAGLVVLKEVVHAVAIASVCAYAFGYAVLARWLGLQRPLVLAGLMAYWLGCVAMTGATILDGFVTPHIAIDAIGRSQAGIDFAYMLVHAVGIVLNDLAKLGWILQAAGTLAWSIALLRSDAFHRSIGVIGLLSSGMVIALIAGSATQMAMTSLLSVLVAQLTWNLAAAVMLVRRPSAITRPTNPRRHMFAPLDVT